MGILEIAPIVQHKIYGWPKHTLYSFAAHSALLKNVCDIRLMSNFDTCHEVSSPV